MSSTGVDGNAKESGPIGLNAEFVPFELGPGWGGLDSELMFGLFDSKHTHRRGLRGYFNPHKTNAPFSTSKGLLATGNGAGSCSPIGPRRSKPGGYQEEGSNPHCALSAGTSHHDPGRSNG
jgi:hypothetical protein